jgi:HEAT repeat protein
MYRLDYESEDKAGFHWVPIIDALGEIGDARAVEPLLKLHEYRQEFDFGRDVFAGEVHDAVLVALGKIGDPATVPWLVETFWAGYSTHLEGDDDMIYHGCREAAREALENIGEPAIDSVVAVFDYYGGETFETAVPQECTRWDILEETISLLRRLAGANRTAEILLKVIEKEISQGTKLKDNMHEHDDPWSGCSLCGSIEAKVCAAMGLVNMKHDKASEKLLEVYELALSLRPAELLGEQSVEPLIKAFEEGNLFVAEALGKSGGSAVEPLIKALGNSDCDMRVNAIDALGDIGDVRAVEPLVTTLKDEEGRVRYRSASALGKIGDARAVQPLIGLLSDDNWAVRQVAAEALGAIGDARAVEPLIEMLGDNRSAVRISSAQALDKLGWVPETDELRGIYLVAKNDWHAITEMGYLAVEPLFKALGDVDDSVRRDGVITLGNIGDARAVEPLIKVLEDIKYLKINTATIGQVGVRRHAANALGKIGDTRAIEPLSQAIEDDDWQIRCNVAKALGEISDVRAVEHLIGALRDDNRYVRKSAAEALGKIGNERAVEPLIGVLEDEYVHDAAKEALKKLGHEVE